MSNRTVVATHQTCPKCGHDECFTEFEDGSGYCHSVCNGLVSNGSGPTNRATDTGVHDGLVAVEYDYRGIPCSTWSSNGCTILGTEGSTEPLAIRYDYPNGTHKLRILPKDFSKNKGFRSDTLFGLDQYNSGSSKVLTIVEGEDDRIAALHMLSGKWPVVALPSASISKKLIQNVKKDLDAYKTLVICTDGDEAGDRAAVILETAFPNKCYRVSMSKHKDPMAYFEAGDADEWVYAWINRTKFVKPFDTNTPQQFKKLYDEAVDDHYLPTGIEDYDSIGLGLFQGHLTVFTAPEGIGKTEFMRMLEYGLIRDHPDVPFAYCHLEETPQRSLLGLCSYHLDKNVTRRDLIEDGDAIHDAIDDMMERETVHQFRIGVDENPQVLIERVQYYANVCGCKYVFFEPLQDLASQKGSGESKIEFLDNLAIQLARTASETGCGIVTIAHMNDNGEIRDSRLIGKQASVRVDLIRNLEAEDDDERNRTRLYIRKNRPVGPTGYAGELTFDPLSFTLKESSYAGD